MNYSVSDYVLLSCVYLYLGIMTAHIGKLMHHSKILRFLEILFWPAAMVSVILYGSYCSIASVFDDEDTNVRR